MKKKLRVGVSACVLGHKVRYNGGHKANWFVRDHLSEYVDFVPVCPEVEIGMGTPRETIRLVQPRGGKLRLVGPKSGSDYTDAMQTYAAAKVEQLADRDLAGFIVQKGSPSCGMERVRIYPPKDGVSPRNDGRGMFTAALMEKMPHLPVEEDGRLSDPVLRESFVVRIFAYQRVKELFAADWTVGQLVEFHSREKLLLMAHANVKPLGQLVAAAKRLPRAEVEESYQKLFLGALAQRSTVKKHTNVLQHVAGYFRRLLDSEGRQEVHGLIDDYRRQLVPLSVPMALLHHHVRQLGLSYIAQQTYLTPHPKQLALRNHTA